MTGQLPDVSLGSSPASAAQPAHSCRFRLKSLGLGVECTGQRRSQMRWRAIVLGLAVSFLFLKGELLPIRTYTVADGLAADSVYGIVADSRGFLWFSTSEGLSRFDGYRFVTYGEEEGLPHALVTALIETRSGDHWIGTPRDLAGSRPSAEGPVLRTTTLRRRPPQT